MFISDGSILHSHAYSFAGRTERPFQALGSEQRGRRRVHDEIPFTPFAPPAAFPPTPPPPREALQAARPSPRRLLVFSVSVPSAVGRGPRVTASCGPAPLGYPSRAFYTPPCQPRDPFVRKIIRAVQRAVNNLGSTRFFHVPAISRRRDRNAVTGGRFAHTCRFRFDSDRRSFDESPCGFSQTFSPRLSEVVRISR